jgi:hypothetical protein
VTGVQIDDVRYARSGNLRIAYHALKGVPEEWDLFSLA